MAANIEQIFQDFILNKIREIEDQSEDKSVSEEAAGGTGRTGTGTGTGAGQGQAVADGEGEGVARDHHHHHKKHRKHKSKKKKKRKKRHLDQESHTESGSETEGANKRRGTPTPSTKQQGDDQESWDKRHHSKGKKKKKKKKKKRRRRRDGDDSSDDGSKRRGATPVRPQGELPDIIPKQDSASKGRADEETRGRRGSRSPPSPQPCPQSHSSLGNAAVASRPRQGRSRSRSRSSPCREGTSPLDGPSGWPQEPPPPLLQQAEGQTEMQDSGVPPSEKAAKGKEERAAKGGSDAVRSIPAGRERPARQGKSPERRKRRRSKSSPPADRERKSSRKRKRSKSPHRSYRRGSRSKSPAHRKRSRSRSGGRRLRRSHSRSASRAPKRVYSQRDRWKREPSHSPVLILRKNRSPSRKHCSSVGSPQRISELDKEQLLEIAKANAAAMCAKAGMPIPASLRTTVLPLALPSMAMNAAMASMTAATVTAALSNISTLSSLLPLPSITNKPPPAAAPTTAAALEEARRKVAKQANSLSIKEFTDKCRMIADSTGELPVALPHVSDEEDDGKPFGESALREQKVISFNINNMAVRPTTRSDADMAKEFPVSSGSQHRKKEGEGPGVYGEWVPVVKKVEKAASALRKGEASVPATTAPPPDAGLPEATEEPAFGGDSDKVFPDHLIQPVDITQAVTERIKAQRRLAENPYDISAICMLSRAQEQVDAWAQSNTVPGLFTGSTGAQVLTSEELSSSGPQAWLKKDQFLRAAPVSGGVGEFLMRKMGWRTGEGLGRNREGTVEPIVIDFKVDRKGLVAEGEKPQKQTGGLVVTKDLMGKHPVSALIELCNKRRIMQPDFVMVHHSGPDHRKNFLFKVTVNGVDYQPQTASPNKKHAKAMAATVALQALGEVPADGPGLYTGPVFTAASTGPLFST